MWEISLTDGDGVVQSVLAGGSVVGKELMELFADEADAGFEAGDVVLAPQCNGATRLLW
jgi:hypothetical protein